MVRDGERETTAQPVAERQTTQENRQGDRDRHVIAPDDAGDVPLPGHLIDEPGGTRPEHRDADQRGQHGFLHCGLPELRFSGSVSCRTPTIEPP